MGQVPAMRRAPSKAYELCAADDAYDKANGQLRALVARAFAMSRHELGTKKGKPDVQSFASSSGESAADLD